MSNFHAFTRRIVSPVLLGVLLVAAMALGAGCTGVTIAPADPAWTVTGEGEKAVAVWRAGDVEIVVPLHYPADATQVSADVRNLGPDAARITFSLPTADDTVVPVGSVTGGTTASATLRSETVLPGQPLDVPPGTPDRPGTLHFALRLGSRWGTDAAPVVGTSVVLGALVTTRTGEAAVPMSFRVTESSEGGWAGMTDATKALVVLFLTAAAWALAYWV